MKRLSFTEEVIKVGGLRVHDEPPAPPADPTAPPAEPPTDPTKTFSQEDVNNLIAKNTKAATEKLLKDLGLEDFEGAKDGLKKYQEWQKSQKTDLENLTLDLENLKKDVSAKDLVITEYKNKELAFEKGVKDPKNQARLVKLAEASGEEDMAKAMDAVLVEFPMLKGDDGQGGPGQFGAGSRGRGGSQSDDVRASVRKAMGMPAKK